METRHHDALASAVQRAHQAFLRQQQAAKNCVGGEKRRQQLQASCDKAQAYWCDLREAVALIQQLPAAQTTAPKRRGSCSRSVPWSVISSKCSWAPRTGRSLAKRKLPGFGKMVYVLHSPLKLV